METVPLSVVSNYPPLGVDCIYTFLFLEFVIPSQVDYVRKEGRRLGVDCFYTFLSNGAVRMKECKLSDWVGVVVNSEDYLCSSARSYAGIEGFLEVVYW